MLERETRHQRYRIQSKGRDFVICSTSYISETALTRSENLPFEAMGQDQLQSTHYADLPRWYKPTILLRLLASPNSVILKVKRERFPVVGVPRDQVKFGPINLPSFYLPSVRPLRQVSDEEENRRSSSSSQECVWRRNQPTDATAVFRPFLSSSAGQTEASSSPISG